MAFVILFCTALAGHPQMNVCDPINFPSYGTLEECNAEAAKIRVGPDSGVRAVHVCMEQAL
jgi:hypothetical protein